MKLNVNWKSVGKVSLYILVGVAFIVSLGFAAYKQDAMPCTKLNVVIKDTLGHNFVDIQDVRTMVENKVGPVEGKPISSINISMLEKIINTNPFISDAEVFSTIDGSINIEVKQRVPVLRVMNMRDESFYIDDQGVFMPLSDKYAARVPLASGFIFDTESERKVTLYDGDNRDTSLKITRIDEVFHVADYISHDEFWSAQIEQIYVNEKSEIELIPRVGNQNIILGNADQLDRKFKKLFLFYKEGLNKTGWNKYSTINLKYENQVVCTKR